MRSMVSKLLTVVPSLFKNSRGMFYKKSLILILLSASIPGLIIGGSVYWVVSAKMEFELIQGHQKQMTEQFLNIDDQLNYLELTLSHWAFEPRFDESLQTLDFVYYFTETRDIYKTLLVMQGSHPLIDQVDLYVDRLPPVRFNPDYNPIKDPGQVEFYKRLLNEGGSAYWTTAANAILLVHKIMDVDQHPFGVLAATLDREKVDNMLTVLNPYDTGTTFLMDRDHEIFATVQRRGSASDSFDAALKAAVLQRERPEGSFVYNWKGDDYSVSFGMLSRIDTDWIYVSATPISAITSPILFASKLIFFCSVSGFVLALAMSWFASIRIYSPVKRLLHLLAGGKKEHVGRNLDEFQFLEKRWGDLSRESRLLQTKLQEQLPYIRESFLLQLFHQHLNHYSEQELKERMKHYGWETDDRQFIVANVRLTGISKSEGRFSHEDSGIATFASANMIQELASSRLQECNVINLHDLSIGLLVRAADAVSTRIELLHMCKEATHAINQVLRFRVTITICKPTDSLRAIPILYEEANQVSWARIVADVNQLIDLEQSERVPEADRFHYPFALEREIVQAIRGGQREEAERLIVRFVSDVSEQGNMEAVVRQSLLLLVGNIQHTIMQSGISSSLQLEGAALFDKLLQMRDREQMVQLICGKIVSLFILESMERTNSQNRKIIEQAKTYIDTKYAADISLESCADQLGVNPFTLSKTFKQVTGINFIDYVTELRIHKAKELLRETDMRMNDIAESVGYQQTYFNRIFKKQEGVTPGQYRDMSRT